MQPATDLADALAGFIAAEGTFIASGRRFTFTVALGAADIATCELLRSFLGVGHVRQYPRRRPHHQDQAIFSIGDRRALETVLVPFLDTHLRASYKRRQYEAWRALLVGAT